MRILSLIACLVLGSCAAAPPSPQVHFADDLSGYVIVSQPRVERTEDNLLQVWIPIQNVSGDDLELLVQVEFRDAAGNPYNDDTPKQVLLLPRGKTEHFPARSMLSKADDFVATIWRSR